MTLPAPEPLTPELATPPAPELPSRTWRFTVIGVLYLVTDIGFAFFLGALTTILLNGGMPPATVGAISLVGLVYVLRFAIGPIVDRYGSVRFGHYRSWIVVTQLLVIGALLWLATIDPLASPGLLVLALAAVLVPSAFHDAAVNGLAVRLLAPRERGIGNGIQVGAATISAVIGTGLALIVYDAIGWTPTVLLLAALFVLPLVVMAFFHEAGGFTVPRRVPWEALPGFFRSRRRAVFVVLIVPALCLGPYLVTAIQSAMLLDAGWSLSRIGVVLGTVSPIAGLLGGLVVGWLISRFGRLVPLLAVGALYAVGIFGLLPLAMGVAWDTPATVALVVLYLSYASAGVWVYTIAMDNTRPELAATDFSLQIGVIGLLRLGLNSGGLALIAVAGFPLLVTLAGLLTVAGVTVAAFWARGDRGGTGS
ncbi:MFS transporter [Protaetiibacter intestinalis]|nr:MFS transporter [Protaetiibacter intestinalis]